MGRAGEDMKGSEIEIGRTYLAYCGSLGPVRALEAQVPFAYPGQVAPKRQGVRVVALQDIPLAADWQSALREGREPRMCHARGEEFVIPVRDVDRLANRDIVLIDAAPV